ncbi:hypothetical protein Nepgr_010460 [Nepenthes gracilis]|uniref:Uncharacterized protein n=1 Tax=Nepenthes gracilis TaxID=150966 RepID=A0AAD3SD60_NEPGR|nr:hypothetical protein Nepgr_010460 [Nepenthes gracilis]
MKHSHPRTTKGKGNLNGQVTASAKKVDPDPIKLSLCKPMGYSGIDNDGFPIRHANGPRTGTHMCLASSDQEGDELDPCIANGCPNAAHLFADVDSQHYLPGSPMHALALVEVVHEIRSSSAKLSITGAGFCELTPDSITKLSCKYSQDTSWALAAELQCCKNDGAYYVQSASGSQQFLVNSPMTASDQVEEVVEDEDNFHDPTLNALKMLLEENAT